MRDYLHRRQRLDEQQVVKPLIDHLEQQGYLERGPDPHDHRAQRIHTTPRGKQLMAAASLSSPK